MILKIFRVIWFFSILAVLVFFLYTYAALPDPLVILDGEEQLIIGKETWFYAILALVAIFNMFVYVLRSLNKNKAEGEGLVTWFYGLVICLNVFIIVAVSYISLFNGGERFEYHRIGIIIYGSIALLIAWAVVGPVYLIFSKKKPI
ncbi:MAG TPA: hypothetical protein VF473_07555 [Cyclobacteriaceae bacterium]